MTRCQTVKSGVSVCGGPGFNSSGNGTDPVTFQQKKNPYTGAQETCFKCCTPKGL
jgi:hypothetical protein